MYYDRNTNWDDTLDDFGRELLARLGYAYIPSDSNPVTDALSAGGFVDRFGEMTGFNKAAVTRVAVSCQMAVYDASGGPDGDGKPRGLRRQWYSWFKTRFAQLFSAELADHGDAKESTGFDGTAWAGRMSTVYGEFVDERGVTYTDLWVDDSSRMIESFYETLFDGAHILLAVEKDSLFADFKTAASLVGAKSLVSGKGKQSKAATEKVLIEHFRWSKDWDPFTAENPLIVLHISDHDFDGESVIGPTFGEQCRRYTPHVVEARVGVKPEQVDDQEGSWYEVKTTNGGYIGWAEDQALFVAECMCGEKQIVQGSHGNDCRSCGLPLSLVVKAGRQVVNQPYGFEVESLPTKKYYGLIVDALLEVLDFDYLVGKLRDKCQADVNRMAARIRDEILSDNESYQELLARFDELEKIKEEFESRIYQEMYSAGEPHASDWRDEEDDPDPADFVEHVSTGGSWAGAWMPFDKGIRTDNLTDFVKTENIDRIVELKNERIW